MSFLGYQDVFLITKLKNKIIIVMTKIDNILTINRFII